MKYKVIWLKGLHNEIISNKLKNVIVYRNNKEATNIIYFKYHTFLFFLGLAFSASSLGVPSVGKLGDVWRKIEDYNKVTTGNFIYTR